MVFDIEHTAKRLQHEKKLINRFAIREFKKTRWVNEPIPELKNDLKEWNQSVTDHFVNELEKHHLTDVAHAYLPGKSIKTNALMHKNSPVIIKFDFKGFYDSVLYDYIKHHINQTAEKKIKNHNLVKRLIIDPETNGLTQGLPVSGALAGLALIPFWKELRRELKKQDPNIEFTQYSDDLTFSTIDGKESACFNVKKLNSLIIYCLKKSKRTNFKIKEEKTCVQRRQFRKVTGVRINHENKLCCSRKDYRMLQTITHVLDKDANTLAVLKAFGFKSKASFVGKISYMRSIDDTGKIQRYIDRKADIYLKHELFKTWIINKQKIEHAQAFA